MGTEPRNTSRDAAHLRPTAEFPIIQDGLQKEASVQQLSNYLYSGNADLVRVGGVAIATGKVTDGASGVRSVSFPAGAFDSAPAVSVAPVGAAGTEMLFATVYNVTATGCDVRISTDGGLASTADFHWTATGAAGTGTNKPAYPAW